LPTHLCGLVLSEFAGRLALSHRSFAPLKKWREIMAENWIDPIVEEVRKIRDNHASKFNYDLRAIYQELKAKEATSGRKYVSYEPRRVSPTISR
jgi:hypothetical protein